MAYLLGGYLNEWDSAAKKHRAVHRRVWIEAHGPIPQGLLVHHKNEDKLDNRAENLELVTRAEHPKCHRVQSNGSHRRCARCEEWKPRSEFYTAKGYCKPCAASYLRERRRRLSD